MTRGDDSLCTFRLEQVGGLYKEKGLKVSLPQPYTNRTKTLEIKV